MSEKSKNICPYLHAAQAWYESNRARNGSMKTNVMNAGLIVSQMVSDGLPIEEDRLFSDGRSQVRGLSGTSIAKILERHGENRLFTREGGRTSRGTVFLAKSFRDTLNDVLKLTPPSLSLAELSFSLERYFTNCIRLDYFDKQRISVELQPSKPVSIIIEDILRAAAERSDKPTGAVLQHLVGAKLQLRFPNENIGLDQANAADMQTDREGDFQVGTTAFHVTVAPMEKLINRCNENKKSGYRPVILTLDRKVMAAKQMADNAGIAEDISVQSAEVFIGNNIEEIAIYDGDEIRQGIASLIEAYNNRIAAVEVDKSLMIEEPRWISELLSKRHKK